MADRLALTVARSSSAHCQAQQRNFDSISPCLKLNEDACLNLDVIIGSFSAPITEEHAWAIVFEAVKCLENLVKNQNFSSTSNNSRYVYQLICYNFMQSYYQKLYQSITELFILIFCFIVK